MNRLERVLAQALDDLAEIGMECALVGGLAVSARTEPRFTRDVDLAISSESDRSAEGLVRDLLERGYRVDALVEQEATGRLATARLLPRGVGMAGVVLDLLFASSGIEAEIVEHAEHLEVFPGRVIRVALPSHLLALKVLARDDASRPQDPKTPSTCGHFSSTPRKPSLRGCPICSV